MNNSNNSPLSKDKLREAAERRLNIVSKLAHKEDELHNLVQDLHIHQVELEMQNEELARTTYEAELFSTRYAELFDFAPISLFILNKIGIIKDINLAANNFLGEEKKQIINKRFQSFIHPEFTDSFYFFSQQVLKTREKQTLELRMVKKSGSKAYVIVESRKLHNSMEGDPEILIAVVDITERKNVAEALLKAHKELDEKVKERTRELEDANQALRITTEEKLKNAKKIYELNYELLESEKKLRELNESKDKFFAIIAHDLRSPFVGIMGYSKLLVSKIDKLNKEEITLYAQNIYTYASNFEKLINDLLSWSNVQIGNFSFEPKKIEASKIIAETIDIFSINAEEKEITIFSDCQSSSLLFADENMLKSIFRNLLSNAIKFTHNGGKIEICTEDRENNIVIRVKDNGKGMSERIKKRIFQIDQRALALGTANERGNGLGLILSREFVLKHGGEIWFESEEGKGSTFFLTLPKMPL